MHPHRRHRPVHSHRPTCMRRLLPARDAGAGDIRVVLSRVPATDVPLGQDFASALTAWKPHHQRAASASPPAALRRRQARCSTGTIETVNVQCITLLHLFLNIVRLASAQTTRGKKRCIADRQPHRQCQASSSRVRNLALATPDRDMAAHIWQRPGRLAVTVGSAMLLNRQR